jgi:hypothetical protein
MERAHVTWACMHIIFESEWPPDLGYGKVETRPPFCTVVHFVYILIDPDPTWKACPQQIRLTTDMKFAGINIYGHLNIWCEDQHRLTTKKSTILETFCRRNHNPSSGDPYDKWKQLWKNVCIKIILQSHHIHYHFNTTSDKIYMTNKSGLWNIPLIDSNTHDGLVSRKVMWGWAWGG